MSVRRKFSDLLKYFNPFAAKLEPPQDEDIPAAKKPRLESAVSTAFDVGVAVGVHTTARVAPASPNTVAVAPRDVVPVSSLLRLQRTDAPRALHRIWTAEEEAKLTDAVTKHGNKWVAIAAIIPGRNYNECRIRWLNKEETSTDNNITETYDTDVLCGRGGAALRHPGNKTYRCIVNLNKGLYTTSLKTEKTKISRLIVASIREQRGRFLEKNKDFTWYDIGDKRAIEKTSQALRGGQKTYRPNIEEIGGTAGSLMDSQFGPGPGGDVYADLPASSGGGDMMPPPPYQHQQQQHQHQHQHHQAAWVEMGGTAGSLMDSQFGPGPGPGGDVIVDLPARSGVGGMMPPPPHHHQQQQHQQQQAAWAAFMQHQHQQEQQNRHQQNQKLSHEMMLQCSSLQDVSQGTAEIDTRYMQHQRHQQEQQNRHQQNHKLNHEMMLQCSSLQDVSQGTAEIDTRYMQHQRQAVHSFCTSPKNWQ